ncbi:MAG: DUF3558 domain-containing protein [Umezawaea sp.]
MRRLLPCALALPALILLACSTPTHPTADHGSSSAPPSEPTTTTTTTVSQLPRPREVELDGLDPCKVLGEEQRAALSLDYTPNAYVDKPFGESKVCSFRSGISGNVTRLAFVTVEGVGVWLSENAQVEPQFTTIGGFPAMVIRTPGLDYVCNVEVDVAEGQFLDVMFRDGGNEKKATQDTLCAGAERVAEAALSGLLEQR